MSGKQSQITNRPPLVIAHRGASAEQPENTLPAFRRALALGVDGMEMDVHITRDGAVVVFHDNDLRRLTGRQGRVARSSWRELRTLRVRGVAPIPRLADVLRLVRGRALVQIEIKRGVRAAPVVRAVRKARASEWVILASFSPGIVRDARRLAPGIPRMLISEGRVSKAALLRSLGRCGARGLSVDHRAVRSAAWLRFFQSRGHPVWCWTVNDPRAIRRLAGWGTDAILCDNPRLLRRILKSETVNPKS